MTNHTNDERTVRCPVEGCDATPLARGINLHILRSSDDGHGPQGEMPDSIDLDNLKTVGEREVEMDYPDEREPEQVARLCPYCVTPHKGKNGVLIHLGQTAGRKNHPPDAAERHDKTDFPRVELDEQDNIINTLGSADELKQERSTGPVPRRRVYQLIADLLAEDRVEMAQRVRRALIGVNTTELSEEN